MVVAIVSTKIPILLGHDFWIFHPPKLPRYGFWSMSSMENAGSCASNACHSLHRRVPCGETSRRAGCRRSARPVRVAHEARADFCTLLGSLYLLIEGGGRWSLDALLSKNSATASLTSATQWPRREPNFSLRPQPSSRGCWLAAS